MATKKSFEEQMARLGEIVSILERGDAPLADSIKLFEEGVKLSETLGTILEKAEQKVTLVAVDDNGEITEQPFSVEDDA